MYVTVESAIHFFLHCPLYTNERRTLLNSLVNIDHTLLDNTNFSLTQILLFGNTTFNAIENTKIINLTIDFVLSTKRFDEPLLWIVFFFCLLPLTTIHQTTKESFTRWVQDSWISATIYWLVAIRYYHIEFFFWCHQSPGSASVKFCRRFFILIKKF